MSVDPTTPPSDGTGAGGPTGGTGGTTTTTGQGAGGTQPMGCTSDVECTEADAARCDTATGECEACTESPQCEGVADAAICDDGTCVECTVGDSTACNSPGETCDLTPGGATVNTCVAVAEGDVETCEPCSNDLQCESGHRCIALEFPEGVFEGYYCLKQTPGCPRPLTVGVASATSINGETTGYCGPNQDLATCPAVNALIDDWRCPSGEDGMCSPDGLMPEVPVPGALCRTLDPGVSNLENRCTYACGNTDQCLDPIDSPARSTCDEGEGGGPNYCGG